MVEESKEEEEVPLPNTCDIKEALIVKLEELDTKIFMLLKSNKIIAEDLRDDPEMPEYLKENEGIIMKTKDEILKILNAFMKAGIDLDKEGVLMKMPHRGLYMIEEEGSQKASSEASQRVEGSVPSTGSEEGYI